MATDLATQAAAAAAAANVLARRVQPSSRNWQLTLADHHDIVYSLDCGALAALSKGNGVLAGAARLAAAASGGRDARMQGLHDLLRGALVEAEKTRIGDARSALHTEVSRLGGRTVSPAQAEACVQRRARNRVRQRAEATSDALWQLANGIESRVNQVPGIPGLISVAADLAAVVESLLTVVTSLEATVGFEALLIDGAFREARMKPAVAARVNAPLVATGRALYQVRVRVQVAAVTVQTGAGENAA